MVALIARTPGVRLLGMTGNMHTAVSLCERLRPDVVMIDAVLDPRCHLGQLLAGGEEGVSVLSLVREPLRHQRYLATALTAGVHGMVLRSAEPAQLIDAIRRTHLERRYLDPELAALASGLGLRHTMTARQPLSRREYQVLQLISDGMENQALAKALFVSVETIRTHVKSILRKLHARDRAHAVAVAFRLGVLVTHREAPALDVPVARTSTPNGQLPHLPHGQLTHGARGTHGVHGPVLASARSRPMPD
jgi:DNA-binding NarL/FixJ family response regulator